MYKFVITSTDSFEIANKISNRLVTSKLSPCVQILDGLSSQYIWKDRIESQKEYLVIVKCKSANCKEVAKYIESVHNYEIAEIIQSDFDILNSKYKKWFDKSSI